MAVIFIAVFLGGMFCSKCLMAPSVSAKPGGKKTQIVWEDIISDQGQLSRARVVDGWLVKYTGNGITYVPDSEYKWR